MMFATALQNDVVSLRTQTQKTKDYRSSPLFFVIRVRKRTVQKPRIFRQKQQSIIDKAFVRLLYNMFHSSEKTKHQS